MIHSVGTELSSLVTRRERERERENDSCSFSSQNPDFHTPPARSSFASTANSAALLDLLLQPLDKKKSSHTVDRSSM